MLVKCSGCAAKIRIKDEQIKTGGSSFKCPRCSKVLVIQKPSKTDIPPEIKKWNWGAFLITPIWGIGNRVYIIALLVFIPFVNMIIPFYFGVKGNEIAWRKKQWDSIDHFKQVQKKWTYAGFIFNLIVVLIIILHPDLGFIFFD